MVTGNSVCVVCVFPFATVVRLTTEGDVEEMIFELLDLNERCESHACELTRVHLVTLHGSEALLG